MRGTLGLGGAPSLHSAQQRPAQARTRHHFVRDGEVPVEIVTGLRVPQAALGGQVAALQAALVAERAARFDDERALAEAQATIRSLQTKLAHAELTYEEALAAERRAREQAEAALRDAVAVGELTGQRLNEAAAAQVVEAPTPPAKVKQPTSPKPASRTPAATTREPQPMKWWLPSYKAKAKGR